ncbi:MAG: hypothetical protein JW882_03310 [Deltaproteobacteria bacterium]|nr:hypothetical protein [Deltaproteobacteria bacterium]
MPEKGKVNLLSDAIKTVSQLLREDDVEGVIIGGLAASLLGRPRYTDDIDLLILNLDEHLPEFIEKLERFGIYPRINDAEGFAKDSRVLLMRHESTGINIDISMGILPFENEAVSRRLIKRALDTDIFLPTPEDLIIMKSISERSKDLEDIKAIIIRNSELDKKRILRTVREFADALENEDIYNRIKGLLN